MKLTRKRINFYWKFLLINMLRLIGYSVTLISLSAIILSSNFYPNYLIFPTAAIMLAWPFISLYLMQERVISRAEEKCYWIDGIFLGFFLGIFGLPFWPLLNVSAVMGYYTSNYGLKIAFEFLVIYLTTMAISFFLFAPSLQFYANNYVMVASILGLIITMFTSLIYSSFITNRLNTSRIAANNALEDVERANHLLRLSISSFDTNKIAKAIFDYLNEQVLNFELLTIQTLNLKENTITCQAIVACEKLICDTQAIKKMKIIMDGSHFVERSLVSAKPYVLNNIKKHAVSVYDKQFLKLCDINAVAVFPDFLEKKVSGLVSLYSRKAFQLDENELKTLALYAKQISLGINNSLLYSELKSNTKQLEKTHQKLEDLSHHLGRYLSPQVVDKIFHGTIQRKVKSQRKYLTIFMSDIVSFTNIVERASSSYLNKELNEYLSAMTEVAFEYGGTVNKYVGDAIIVVFGDPSTAGKHHDAINAVLMAEKMLKVLDKLNDNFKVMRYNDHLGIRIGICSGFANVGNYGSEYHMDYTVIGSVLNLANRLHDVSEPDSIIISDSTKKLIKNVFHFSDNGKFAIKGFEKKIQTWKVLGTK